jgi:hypothetical protein
MLTRLEENRTRAQEFARKLEILIAELRRGSANCEPQMLALSETAAEVLGGLGKAFRDYAQKNEGAWRVGNKAPEDKALPAG